MASTRKHPPICEKAKGHVCKCGNCGGSQHGWVGWTRLAREPDRVREAERSKISEKLREWWSSKRGAKVGNKAKAAIMDLLRFDCTRWLAWNDQQAAEVPTQRPDADSAPERSPDDRPLALPGADPRLEHAGDTPSPVTIDIGQPASLPEHSEWSPVVDQVDALARAMTQEIWRDIVENIEGSPAEVKAIRLQLADHGWCDLFIGFVMVLEKFRKVFDEIPDTAKKLIVEAVLRSSRQEKRPQLTEQVVGMIVDKAWGAFKAALIAHSPLLGALTSDELLRNLRLLAVFICPAPEKHEEVQKHAVEPLVDDVRGYVTDETKEWLRREFGQWATGVERQAKADGAVPAVRPAPA
ncbi:hypothetical protein [Amycolatopsis sp. MEPSY49]|uniref:hypothetical protein n=1 Tax=Amycolatopsis sp. MEPSY49 TaxID=3151600 RepID=UPI003EF7A779